MTDWLCIEYSRGGKELMRYHVKGIPPGVKLWHLPKHPKARIVKCEVVTK